MPPTRLPSLLALRAFEVVSRKGSMKAAAEELSVTPGAISQLIKKLESQLDCTLLVRVNRGFELTPAGIRLNDGLADAFVRMRAAVDEVAKKEQANRLVVACGPPFASRWLVPRLHKFLAKHPDVDIRISASLSKCDFQANDVDIGIRLSNEEDPKLERQWLEEECLMTMASPDFIERYQLSEPKDLLRVPLLSEETNSKVLGAPGWHEWFSSVGLDMPKTKRGVNFGDSVEQALTAAIAGVGVVLGRKTLASLDLEQGRLVCPFGPELPTGIKYQIVKPKTRRCSDHLLAFKEWLASEFGLPDPGHESARQ